MLITTDIAADPATLARWIAQLAKENLRWLRANPSTPSIYAGWCRYEAERGTERWQTLQQLRSTRKGDCEDLVAARTAELWMQRVEAQPLVIRISPQLSHTFIRLPDGRAEDPSARLGMKVPPQVIEALRVRLSRPRRSLARV